jgi:phage terminase large subunit
LNIQLPNGWTPREYQLPLWRALAGGTKRAIAIWHRRAGKDDVCLHWAAVAAHERPATYWHLLPEAAQARKAIWDAVNPHTGKRRIDEAFPLELRRTTRENEMFIGFHNGASWQVVGSDNYQSLLGSPPAGVVFSEWSRADPMAWAAIRPILAENDGWAVFITTPAGPNHAQKMLEAARGDQRWFAQILTAEETGVFTVDQLADEKRGYVTDLGLTEDEAEAYFRQEYLCDFAAPILGSYYAKLLESAERDGRICPLPYNPAIPVHTSWDIGYGDSTAIWFWQVVGPWIHAVDYYESSGEGVDFYARILQERKYSYGTHYAPPDAGNGSPQTGKTWAKMFEPHGIKFQISRSEDPDVKIAAMRLLLPTVRFDRQKTARGREALAAYHKQYNSKLRDFKPHPVHDWSSHAAAAAGEFAIQWREKTAPKAKPDSDGYQRDYGSGSWMA